MIRSDVFVRAFRVASALLCFSASLASAAGGGINLGWDDCGGLPASQNKAFLCNTNSGTHTLVASFVAPCCLDKVTFNEDVLDLQSVTASFPSWWIFRTGSCRSSSLSYGDFAGAPFTCLNYWAGRLPAIGVYPDDPVGNRMRIRRAIATGAEFAGPIPEGTETYSLKFVIDNARTTEPGSCAGCATGVCIVLNSIKILQPAGTPGGDKFISSPASRNWATWQGGIGLDCHSATPARNTTWGSVKGLYR